ncbi:MAG: carboxypeptidase regulatory-like domain-containing protein [Planctomycetaceae bacterium]
MRNWNCVVLMAFCLISRTNLTAEETADGPSSGVVKGRVIYLQDKERPWRYQRYYVKTSKSGDLAEAVVALRGQGLRDVPVVEKDVVPKIDQYNFRFVPETTAIRAGQSIRFTNSDSTTHNIRSVASIAPFNVNLEAEDEYVHRFERAGDLRSPITLGCVYHGGMRAWVYVFDHPFFKVTEQDGHFEFRGVPPGKYTLEMVHPAGQLRWKDTVVVTEKETVEVEIRVSPDQKTLKY